MKKLPVLLAALLSVLSSAQAQTLYPYFSPGGDLTGTAISQALKSGVVTDAKGSLANKPSVGLVATSNLTLSGAQTIDGVLGVAGTTLVLATAQNTGSQNGPWVMQSGAWTRPTWYPSGGTTQAFQFATVLVRQGTTYADSLWVITSAGAVTIDTTATTWAVRPIALNASTVSGVVPAANGGTGEAGAVTGIPMANGSSAFTAAAASNVYSLWSGTCSATTFLNGGGSCTSPVGTTVAGGTADDTAAIQAVINALPASNAVLTFQRGVTYSIGAAGIHFSGFTNLTVNLNGANFVALTDITQVISGTSFRAAILISSCTNCSIFGGVFSGGTFVAGFIGLGTCTDCSVYNNIASNVGRAGNAFAQFVSAGNTRANWHDNIAENSGLTGVRGFWLGNVVAGQMETDLIVGPNNKAINNTGTGFVISAIGAQVFGNYALSNGGSGFISSTATGQQSVDHNFVGNTSIGNTFYGYQTDVTSNVPVLRVSLVGNRFEGNTLGCLELNYAQFFSVVANLCLNNNTAASNPEILINGVSTNLSITGNTIVVANLNPTLGVQGFQTGTTAQDITVSNNNITGANNAAGAAIQFLANAGTDNFNRLTITGNVLSTFARGIYLRAANAADVFNDVVVSSNTMTNMGTDYLKFQGSTANQITNARAIGNSGGLTIDANTTLIEDVGNTWNVPLTAPTISSGFGTSPSVTQNKGYRSFSVNVGTGGTASTGVVGLPTAAHGWACTAADVTTPAGDLTQQTGSTTTTASFTNYVRTTGIAGAWTASDVLQISCSPN